MDQQVSLYFTEGGSDKVYHAQIKAQGDGYVVDFQYGRRGNTLTSGTKTPSPLPFEAAKRTYDKLLKEKMSKGYTQDKSGVAYQGTDKAGDKTDFVPQLLNPISEDEAMRLIEDDDWVAQEKMDGERRAVHADSGNTTGMNRKGLSVPLPIPLADELCKFAAGTGETRVDGEIIGDMLYVFDLHVFGGKSVRQSLAFLARIQTATKALSGLKYVKTVPVAVTAEEKRALWDKVKAARGEGVVFKRRNCLVKEGRPNSGGDWLKFKFTERASCRVASVHPAKRSVSIELFDGQAFIEVGNVTIPANYEVPAVSDIVDVEYLYAYKGGSLYQPVYRGKRADLDIEACALTQLKYKPEGREDDDA